MPASAVAEYARVDAVLAKTTAACSEFTVSQDASLKKYRFALQKAIGTQINAISDQSGQHLLNKINKLRQLLSGRPLEVGGKSVSINDHPQARDYCSSLIAKKLVVNHPPPPPPPPLLLTTVGPPLRDKEKIRWRLNSILPFLSLPLPWGYGTSIRLLET